MKKTDKKKHKVKKQIQQIKEKKYPDQLSVTGLSGKKEDKILVSFEPMTNPNEPPVPENIQQRLMDLFPLIFDDPGAAVTQLEDLIKAHSEIPRIYNYLAIAYSNAGKLEASEAIAKENYQKFPDYLFAGINYGEICVQKEIFSEIPKIFNNQYDLKSLFPDRSVFHITEVIGFYGVWGLYFAGVGDTDKANRCFDILKDLAPENSFTKTLGMKLASRIIHDEIGHF